LSRHYPIIYLFHHFQHIKHHFSLRLILVCFDQFLDDKLVFILHYLDFRSPFDVPGANNSSFGRVPPSQSSAFGGLGSLFPSTLPPFSSTIDRKSEINGSVNTLNLDWARFARGFGPFSSANDGLSSKKVDETNNFNER
jgi:hypothetical protein